MKVVGMCGVSGSGKSTVANHLANKYSDKVTLLSLDDYYKRSFEIGGKIDEINWEDPETIKFDQLIEDIKRLKSGEKVKFLSRSKFYNPSFDSKLNNKIVVEVSPKEIILLEGFLIFANTELVNLLDSKIYLDLDIEHGLNRRDDDKIVLARKYIEENIFPSFKKNILANKRYADFVIDTKTNNIQTVVSKVEDILGL